LNLPFQTEHQLWHTPRQVTVDRQMMPRSDAVSKKSDDSQRTSTLHKRMIKHSK